MSRNVYALCLKPKFQQVFYFVELRAPHRAYFLCRRKVKLRLTTKDSQGTCWFLDLKQVPSGESSFARFSGAMTTKVISAETKTLPCPLSTPPVGLETLVVNEGERDRFAVTAGETSPLRRYQRGHFLFDTLLDTFLVKEKYPQGWAA